MKGLTCGNGQHSLGLTDDLGVILPFSYAIHLHVLYLSVTLSNKEDKWLIVMATSQQNVSGGCREMGAVYNTLVHWCGLLRTKFHHFLPVSFLV